MNANHKGFLRFTPVGEGALLVAFDDALTAEANQQVFALDAQLQQAPLPGVIEWIPAYSSLMVLYDLRLVQLTVVEKWVLDCLATVPPKFEPSPQRVEIRVRYGGAEGPDLSFVADYHHLSPAEVIARHAAPIYRVGMMGFMPGFAYLLGLDPGLATPRLATPRTHIPAGSVGIAGEQTGVYPLASPGGWRLIGQTDAVLFDPEREPYFALSPGDEVRFIPLED